MNGHHPSHKVLASTSDEEALICLSSRNGRELPTRPDYNYWYLDPEVETSINTVSGERIVRSDNRGWTMNRSSVHVHYIYHRVGRLKRVSDNAMEGKFTRHICNDINNNKSLLILYPSECLIIMHASLYPPSHFSGGSG